MVALMHLQSLVLLLQVVAACMQGHPGAQACMFTLQGQTGSTTTQHSRGSCPALAAWHGCCLAIPGLQQCCPCAEIVGTRQIWTRRNLEIAEAFVVERLT